jgi:hypothetical protein
VLWAEDELLVDLNFGETCLRTLRFREIAMIKATSVAAVALAASLLSGVSAAAAAEPPPPAAPAAGSSGPPESGEMNAPVLRLQSVEVIRSTHGGELDIVRVRGFASSTGWEEAELVPLTRSLPADGMLELILVARAPAEAADAKGFESVEAIFTLERKHPFKGVTVRSATDSLTLTQIPGFVDAKAGGEDCAKCVGKQFAAKGSGKSAEDVVREEDLPPGTRVIRPGDGIATSESNPNRLTLVVGKDGRISTAIWE